jgi:hypothetical protein
MLDRLKNSYLKSVNILGRFFGGEFRLVVVNLLVGENVIKKGVVSGCG